MPYLTELTELSEVVMVNLVLSGDNAIVVAMAAAACRRRSAARR